VSLADLLGENRVSDNLDAGHRAIKLEKAARHVVPGGDQSQAAEALLSDPLRSLMRIPKSIVGVVAQHDTAKRPIPRTSGNAQHIVEINLRIDARDEELATLSFAEEFEAALETQTATGQHDNRIGRRCAQLDRRGDRKPNEPGKP